MKLLLDLIGVIFVHAIVVAILGLLGFFVWNSGVVGIDGNLQTISYKSATAIMLGLYMLNMFFKIWIERVKGYKLQKKIVNALNKLNIKE
ncbi:MAG TPA: hypothetical protein VKU94_01325 [Geobacterales bacterium]|nr:hypothetical protein [Geobacterales bacterium]